MPAAADLNPSPADAAFKSMRTATEGSDTQLTAEASGLLASLDDGVRPKELAARYPRIVNKIARECGTLTNRCSNVAVEVRSRHCNRGFARCDSGCRPDRRKPGVERARAGPLLGRCRR